MYIYADSIAVAWLLWIVIWIIAAFGAKKTTRRNWAWMGSRIALIVLFIIVLHFGLFTDVSVSSYVASPALAALGAALVILGLALAVWARYYLGRNWGMPMSHKAEPELVTGGPYASIRHPIYTGILLAFVGSALTLGWWYLILFVVFGAYFVYAATEEEKRMTAEFPGQYPAYKARTSMLVPSIF